MPCNEIRKRLNAWLDNEVSAQEAGTIARHLEQCSRCRQEADGLRQIVTALNALPAQSAPARFSAKSLHLFRANIRRPTMMEWWQGLSMAMRGAVCGAVLTGLLCGAILGDRFAASDVVDQANPYQTLYANQGILP